MPFNVFYPVLQAETAQQYFPRLLLSDYESSIEAALGLLPVPYAKALNGQEGVTTETLGRHRRRPAPEPGRLRPRACAAAGRSGTRPTPRCRPGTMTDYIEEQGPIAGWCQAIRLFATAATSAGPDLNRRTFVTAMSKITTSRAPTPPSSVTARTSATGRPSTRWCELHINSPVSTQCKMPKDKIPQFTCWVSVQPFAAAAHRLSDTRAPAGAARAYDAGIQDRWTIRSSTRSRRAAWHTDGWCVLEHVLPAAEVAAAAKRSFAELFPTAEAVAAGLSAGE